MKTSETIAFEKFSTLIRDQFEYGGQKYASAGDEGKEATDYLFDDFGKNWLYGTLAKYTKRYTNLARERDLLKIATYCYIIWLKKGFQYEDSINGVVMNTNVIMKLEHFDKFYRELKSAIDYTLQDEDNAEMVEPPLHLVYGILKHLADSKWTELGSSDLIEMAVYCFLTWDMNHSDAAGTDTDTWNENK